MRAQMLSARRRSQIRFSIVLSLCLFCVCSAQAKPALGFNATSPIKFFVSHQPPFEYLDDEGNVNGIAIAAADNVFAKLNWRVVYQFDSVMRGIKSLHQGSYDITTIVSPTPSMQTAFLTSAKPLYFINISAIRRTDTPAKNQIEEMRNTLYAAMVENSFTYMESLLQSKQLPLRRFDVPDFEAGINLVKVGRVPYFLTYADPSIVETTSELVADSLMSVPVHLAISTQHENGSAIMQQINAAMGH